MCSLEVREAPGVPRPGAKVLHGSSTPLVPSGSNAPHSQEPDPQQAWKEQEKEAKEKRPVGHDWLTTQELPCRRCTDDNNGIEVWKPVSAFYWASCDKQILEEKVLQKGQDLVCYRCARDKLRWNVPKVEDIYCDGCKKWLSRNKFDEKTRTAWESCEIDIHCHSCNNTKASKEERELVHCSGLCNKMLPENHFIDKMMMEWRRKHTLLEAKCARCVVKSREGIEKEIYTCKQCEKKKCITEFAPVAVKEWAQEEHRPHIWKCYDCLHPRCVLCDTENRPMDAIVHNALIDGKYYCEDHKFPPCKCGKRRSNPHMKFHFTLFTCDACSPGTRNKILRHCIACRQNKDNASFRMADDGYHYHTCKECEEKKTRKPLDATCVTELRN